MSIHSLIQFPEEVRSAAAIRAPLGVMPGDGLRPRALLELRSELGSVYVRPVRWQRLRLLWTFRHFHLLSPDVLSERDRRLIDRLSRSAVVAPSEPVPEEAILGVVEKAVTQSSKLPLLVVPSKSTSSRQPLSPKAAALRQVVAELEAKGLRAARMRRWSVFAMLVCVFVALGIAVAMLVTGLREKRFASSGGVAVAQPQAIAAPAGPAAQPTIPVTQPTMPAALSPTPAALPVPTRVPNSQPSVPLPFKVHRAQISSEPQPTEPAPASDVVYPLLANLPPGPLAKPVVSDPTLVGSLRLRALVGSDGAVKDVTLISGNPKLAQPAMRAIRRWHYPSEGRSGDAQALVGISFFGPDAISITSLAR